MFTLILFPWPYWKVLCCSNFESVDFKFMYTQETGDLAIYHTYLLETSSQLEVYLGSTVVTYTKRVPFISFSHCNLANSDYT